MSITNEPLYLFEPTRSSPFIQNEIETFLNDIWLPIHNQEQDKEIYHYTSLDGLMGILSNRNLWLSHMSILNDPSEIEYGRKLITERIDDFIKIEVSDETKTCLTIIKKYLCALGDTVFHPFVFCFTEESDSLSQWRAYTDQKGCYSIGFTLNNNTTLSSDISDDSSNDSFRIRKVIYEPEQQKILVNECISRFIKAFNTEIDSQNKFVYNTQCVNPLLDMMISFKHKAFRDEKEWRMIRITRQNYQADTLCFRELNGGLIPFRKMFVYDKIEDGSLVFPCTSIKIGPSVEKKVNKIAVELYIQNLLKDNHKIRLSDRIKVTKVDYSLR